MARMKTQMLTAEEEKVLFDAWLDHGDIRARNKIMDAYMPLVKNMARVFAAKGTSKVEDLVQEGAVGLAEAIDKFKRNKDARLSTLATYYIKARLLRYAMDFASHVRIGTNLPDKKVYMNMRRMVAQIQSQNGDRPINDEDRRAIAAELRVDISVVLRMEPRIFAQDIQICHTDSSADEDEDRSVSRDGVISVVGEQVEVEKQTDQARVMQKIWEIVETNYDQRDLEIISQRIQGDMTPEKYDALVSRFGISVERIRQIQRGALQSIREALVEDGIASIYDIAV